MSRRAITLIAFAALVGCGHDDESQAKALTGGDPGRGRELLASYGCGACHSIPGVAGARAVVGPPLDNIASRHVLAGQLPNRPAHMMKWIREPQSVRPGTAMPDVGVTEADARDMAAHLYTLK